MSARAIPGPEIPAIDILDEVAVSVPCASCGGHYPVTLRQVLVAQDLLHEDCPAQREAEWLPTAYAGLANEAAVRELDRAWQRISRQVESSGLTLTFCRPPISH
jgi:hypothetical protein